jgi:two-component system cell cycle sensor histidine kinase/response regulator CckA
MNPLGKLVVLVVDDEEYMGKMLSTALENFGFEVCKAASGAEALRVQAQRPDVDVVVLDVLMAGLDGPATLRALRLRQPDLPCCFITGQTNRYSEDDLLRAAPARVLNKPFPLASLVGALLEMME